jgi:hypothetical protein
MSNLHSFSSLFQSFIILVSCNIIYVIGSYIQAENTLFWQNLQEIPYQYHEMFSIESGELALAFDAILT